MHKNDDKIIWLKNLTQDFFMPLQVAIISWIARLDDAFSKVFWMGTKFSEVDNLLGYIWITLYIVDIL